MNYEEMIKEVSEGKSAFRLVNPDMVIVREGDTIIRKSFRKTEVKQIFVASVEEMKSRDWVLFVEDYEEDDFEIEHIHLDSFDNMEFAWES